MNCWTVSKATHTELLSRGQMLRHYPLLPALLVFCLLGTADSFRTIQPSLPRTRLPSKLSSAVPSAEQSPASKRFPPQPLSQLFQPPSPPPAQSLILAQPRVITCTLSHLPEILSLAAEQFRPTCESDTDVIDLHLQVLRLFLPKLLVPWAMRCQLIGLALEVPSSPQLSSVPSLQRSHESFFAATGAAETEGPTAALPSAAATAAAPVQTVLVGFVDLSLQPQSLKALVALPEVVRRLIYGDTLRPYLCNLIVAPAYRRLGYGRKLVQECLDRSRAMGYAEMYLHVEEKEVAPMGLYRSMGFRMLEKEGYATIMTREVDLDP